MSQTTHSASEALYSVSFSLKYVADNPVITSLVNPMLTDFGQHQTPVVTSNPNAQGGRLIRTSKPKIVSTEDRSSDNRISKKTGQNPNKAVKPKYIVGLSREAQIRMVQECASTINKIWKPDRLVQLAAVRKDVRSRDKINGPIDPAVTAYIQHKLSKKLKAPVNDKTPPPAQKPCTKKHVRSVKVKTYVSAQELAQAKALSQFYTAQPVANWCVERMIQFLPANAAYNFIEPSAGGGVFLDAVQPHGSAIGFDIDPRHKNIIKTNYLTLNVAKHLPSDWKPETTIMIGNPPFGRRSAHAIAFINKGLNEAKYVAFILPKSFRRFSTQSKIREDARLVFDTDLPSEKFQFTGKNRAVGCCFQIWTLNQAHDDHRIRLNPSIKHTDFELERIYPRSDAAEIVANDNWDLAIPAKGRNDYKARKVPPIKDLTGKYWILIKCKNSKSLKKLKSIDFNQWAKDRAPAALCLSFVDVVQAYDLQAQREKVANDNTLAGANAMTI